MDSIIEEYACIPTKILVAVSINPAVSYELLSWAVDAAKNPNDCIVALHVLVGKDEEKIKYFNASKWRQARAFVISLLGEFSDICQQKEVKLEAKVKMSSSVGKGLIDEAAVIDASYLVVGDSRKKSSQRSSSAISSYCFKHAPENCLVIPIGKLNSTPIDTDSVITFSTKSFKLQNVFRSKTKTERPCHRSNSSAESVCDKSSPMTVLDGPETGYQTQDEYYSSSLSNETIGMRRKNIWRRLSSIKLFFPFMNSSFDLEEKETDSCSSNGDESLPKWRCFSYEELTQATDNFNTDNMVGKGGYSEVFKGEISNGQMIAVKRLATDSNNEQKEKEFLTELGILGHIYHPNTTTFIGCSIEKGYHLIFEFSPNGSLSSALHGKTSKVLEWPIRYKIAVGVAKGLYYLHKGCRRRIIHRDIKASNVLLGPDYEPQISDFGLAKWLPKQWTHHLVNPIEGTFGYLAPEYFMHGIVDEKTDIYAFGILLLEIITGRRPVDSSKQSLLLWARPLIDSEKIAELADPKLEGKYDREQLQRLVLIASYCVRQSSVFRPTVTEVLQLLTEGDDSEVAENWRMQDCCSDIEYISSVDDLDCLLN